MQKIENIIDSQLQLLKWHIELLKHNKNTKIIFIHPIGGKTHWYRNLIKELESRFLIQCIDADVSAEYNTLQELAEHYVRKYASFFKSSYHLVGWSFGAYIAYEMACILQNDNAPKEIILIDQPTYDYNSMLTEQDKKMQEFKSWFCTKISEKAKAEKLFKKAVNLNSLGESLIGLLKNAMVESQDSLKNIINQINIYLQHHKIFANYRPTNYLNREVTLIMSDTTENLFNEGLSYQSKSFGWEHLCSRVIGSITIPGDHYSIFYKDKVDVIKNVMLRLLSC